MKINLQLSLSFTLLAFNCFVSNAQVIQDSLLAKEQYAEAEILIEQENYDSAFVLFQESWKYFSSTSDWERKAKIMSFLCSASYKTGRYELAKPYADTAFVILKEAHADTLHHLYGSLYHQYGTMLHIMGDFKKARGYYLKAIVIRETEDVKVSGIINTYNNLGLCLVRLNDFNQAIIYLKKALTYTLKYNANDSYLIGKAYNNLGVAYSQKMDLEYAEKYYNIALSNYTKVIAEPNFDLGDIYLNLSKIANNDSNFAEAVKLQKRAIKNYTVNGRQHRTLPMCYFNLSVTYKMMGKYDSALNFIETSREMNIAKFGVKNPEVGQCYQFEGRVYYAMGDYDNAIHCFQNSLISNIVNFNDTAISAKPDLTYALSQFYLAGTLIWKGSAFREKYLQTGNINFQELALENYFLYDEVTDLMFNNFENEGSRFQLMNDFYENYVEAVQVALELYMETNNPKYAEDAFYFSEKSKSALLTAGINETNAKLFANIPDSLLMEERNVRKEISTCENEHNELMLYDPDDSIFMLALNDSLFSLRNIHAKQIAVFEKEYPGYFSLKYDRQPVSIGFLRDEVLTENTVVMEYLLADTLLYVMAITENDLDFVAVPIDGSFISNIDDYIKCTSDYAYISAHPNESHKCFVESSTFLYNKLFPADIQKQLNGKDHLCIVPDGKLAYVSFDALLTEPPRKNDFSTYPYLIQNFNIQYAYSATLLKNGTVKPDADEMYVGFAPEYNVGLLAQAEELDDFPKFRDNMDALSGNKTEITGANQIFNGSTFFADKANESSFKENAGKYSIIHLAMHALIDDKNPLNSKLVFSQTDNSNEDNFLNTYEIYNLDLNADLAILSACNTSNGILDRGEGVLSLARAFKYAGVNTVVSSLWRAHDVAVENIMLGFFKGVKDNLPLDEALRNSKLEYLQNADPAYAHPFYWANLMVTGDNKPISFSKPWYKQKLALFSISGILVLLLLVFIVRRLMT